MSEKERVSASVDAELVEAGRAAVAAGHAPTLSAWINEALRRQSEHDRRLRALGQFVAAFEAEHGAFTDEEIEEATRSMRARAVVVRPDRRPDEGVGRSA